MDDDKIKDLFNDYKPELTSSFHFMSNLQKNLDAVEIVKSQNLALKKRNRRAIAIAATTGFVMGVIFMLAFQFFGDPGIFFSLVFPFLPTHFTSINLQIISWIVMGGASIITAFNAYEIAMAKLR